MGRYVVLLRGINVGGKNLIGMPALKAVFEAEGFTDVVTFIQSGNVVITSRERAGPLVARIEAALSEAFDYSASRMSRIVALPIYKQMTIRNWNTTTRLLKLMEGGGGAR